MTPQDREVEGVEDALALVARQSYPGPGAGRPAGDARSREDRSRDTRSREDRHEGARAEGALAEPRDSDPSRLHGVGTGRRAKPPAPATASAPAPRDAPRHEATPWARARALAAGAGRPDSAARAHRVPLDQALGEVLSAPLAALTDLPPFDTSAMDGWAVSGPGPWATRSAKGDGVDRADGILAGHGESEPLPDGFAVRIATGARIPPDATAVIRSEQSRTDSSGHLHAQGTVSPGQDIRPRGQECRSGDRLLPAGVRVTPAVLGLAAAAGYDTLLTLPRPRVEVLVLGDELLTEGLPHDGLIRDALGPMIAPWLRALGAEVLATRRIGDDADALYRVVTASEADLVITTGGTAGGPVDHVHPVLRRADAELLVDGVAVRPGHPMLLARLSPGRHLVGLPGNPLAAVSGLLTLAEPLLRALAGRTSKASFSAPVRDDVSGHPHDTRLVPFVHHEDGLVPLHFNGPAMLRGIAAADGLAVVPPGGARRGAELDVLDLPWAHSIEGGCFT